MVRILNDHRIIFVSSIIPPEHSGAGKPIYKFYEHLKKMGVDVHLITKTKCKENGTRIYQIKLMKLKWIGSKANIILNLLYSFIQLITLQNKFIKSDNKKTVVWLVSADILTYAASIIFFLRGYNIITQNTLLGSDDPEFKYPNDILRLKYSFKRLQYRLSRKVTSISPALLKVTKRFHKEANLIPYPTNINMFMNEFDSHEKRLKRKVLIVGRIGYRKGTDIVLKTIKEVLRVLPDTEFTFVGPKDELNSILKKEGIMFVKKELDRIHFVGFKSNPESYFKESSLFFMPSRREGFGIVFIEAMAARMPVVAKKLDGITNFIFGENIETIHDSECPNEFANTIIKLLNNPMVYNNQVHNNLKSIQRFRQDIIYNDYINLIVNVDR